MSKTATTAASTTTTTREFMDKAYYAALDLTAMLRTINEQKFATLHEYEGMFCTEVEDIIHVLEAYDDVWDAYYNTAGALLDLHEILANLVYKG